MVDVPKADQAPGVVASLLRAVGVSKSFPGVRALINVDFDLAKGEVNALVGENGAGKSTLINILSGTYAADEGIVEISGRPLHASPRAAQLAGVATIHQEHHLVPMMSVAENILLGRWPRRNGLIDRTALWAQADAALAQVAPYIRSDRMAATLSPAESQLVEIARALSKDSRILIMDEPTTSLSAPEVAHLFEVVHQLKGRGMGIVFVSHWLEEVFAVADRITVMRDGQRVACRPAADLTADAVVGLMVGRAVQTMPHRPRPGGKIVLDVRGLSKAGAFEDISFAVREGEIVSLAGLVGAGRSEVAACIFGDTAPDTGDVHVDGHRLAPGDIRAAIAAGVALVPEDRRRQALVSNQSVAVNATLAMLDRITRNGVVSREKEAQALKSAVTEVGARMASVWVPISTLSGGNQQKVVIGRWLARKPRLLILDEPTKGIDIGAKAEIMELIQRLTDAGTAIVLITSELPEVLALSDRVLVMRAGRIVGALPRADLSQEAVMNLATLG